MADVFKKQVVRWTLAGKRCQPRTPGATRKVDKSRKWYGTVGGKAVPLCNDKVRSQQLLATMVDGVTRRGYGIHDFAAHRRKPLAVHLGDYAAALAHGNSDDYVELAVGRCRTLFRGCGWNVVTDADTSKASQWLASIMRPGKSQELEAGRTEYTPGEVVELLGCSAANVRSLVKRHGLEATGNGRARRFPRATVQALLDRAAQGTGPETVNHYIRAVRGFFNWMVAGHRIPENPLASLGFLNAKVDVRHARRELTAVELRRLLSVTLVSTKAFRGLDGPARFHLYLTAAATGFRARGLASLEPDNFDLGTEVPTVTLAARFNKSGNPVTQPIPLEVANALAGYLAGRPAACPVWGGTWARDHRGAEMLRVDLEAAGIHYAVEGPDGPLYADFHALRHSYLTLLRRGGVDLRTAQELAGHSRPELTANYSHVRLHDLAGAVEKLPSILPQIPAALAPTGTDGGVSATSEASGGCSLVARIPSVEVR